MSNIVVIDGCNVACGPGGKKPGDARNILSATEKFLQKGYSVIIFLAQHWYLNRHDPEKSIANKPLLDDLPDDVSLSIVPSRSDDDLFFIKYAMENNAFLLSNDGLKSHEERFEGQELLDFQKY